MCATRAFLARKLNRNGKASTHSTRSFTVFLSHSRFYLIFIPLALSFSPLLRRSFSHLPCHFDLCSAFSAFFIASELSAERSAYVSWKCTFIYSFFLLIYAFRLCESRQHNRSNSRDDYFTFAFFCAPPIPAAAVFPTH